MSPALPDPLAMIRMLRPDIVQHCRESPLGEESAYMAWLVGAGLAEYRTLLEQHPTFIAQLRAPAPVAGLTRLQWLAWQWRSDVQQALPLPERTRDFLAWFYRHGVAELRLWPALSAEELALARKVSVEPPPRPPPSLPPVPFARRPFGVNIIGYAYGQLGIGEDARMAARALLAAAIPFTMVDFPPGADIPQRDRSMAKHVTERGDYGINLFCLTAAETYRYFAERGDAQLRGRYNIGYWPWELGRWPVEWQSLTRLVDEVWVSSNHTRDSLLSSEGFDRDAVPVFVMPMAVELGNVKRFADRRTARRHFGLPLRARLFCFSFDLNSSIHRKNPQACVDAFLAAFPEPEWSRERVGLVIKTNPTAAPHTAWEQLKALAARDPRVHIVERVLPRPEVLALYAACDCFLSLHRAEGFGRGIAEALQLGLQVITTGYGGNVDFCTAPEFAGQVGLVRHRLIKIRDGQYPFGEGQAWANASVRHAAALMRAVVAAPVARAEVPRHGWPRFSAALVGAQYRRRLQHVAMRGLRPKWEVGVAG